MAVAPAVTAHVLINLLAEVFSLRLRLRCSGPESGGSLLFEE